MVTYIKSDLEFILAQIKIAEAHAAGQPLYGPGGLIPTYNLAWGLRTVNGEYNNLLHPEWGSADNPFPEPLGNDYRDAQGGDLDMNGPAPGGVVPTAPNYNPSTNPNSIVVDGSVRTISNLIVDQTLDNPAAIMVALQRAGIIPPPGMTLLDIAISIRDVYLPVKPFVEAAEAAHVADVNAQRTLAAALAATPQDPAAIEAAQTAAAATAAASAAADADLATARGPLDLLLAENGIRMDGDNIALPNIAPDEGLSASFNSWFTLFGQFFDHGLDLVGKGGSGTVFIPLSPDDPLYDPASPTNFMVLTRATVGAGPDGILDNPDTLAVESTDDVRPINTTTPFVDQNQTYTSHASHQVFLREYVLVDGKPQATGNLLDGANGGLPTWAEVKAQARAMLGIDLTDYHVGNLPLLATDEYGNFIPHPVTGFAQVVMAGNPPTLASGTPASPLSLVTVTPDDGDADSLPQVTHLAVRTGHAFLDDIAHTAVPVGKIADGDIEIGLANTDGSPVSTSYDNELLDAHFVTGDGRGNENIGLTTVHHVFHSEHNRLMAHTKDVVLATNDLAFINEWLDVGLTSLAQIDTEAERTALKNDVGRWDGERLFQAAKFGTEMQYQHLVFEEFARKIQPNINVFLVPDGYDVTIDPTILAEFAHVVYRFGHSMLTETIDRYDPSFTPDQIGLIEGFLNPLEFASLPSEQMAGAVIRGMTRQVGNHIDEFVTSALRNNLLGLPLDLATINLARGRDTGVPSLNEARRQFYEATGNDAILKPYSSWVEFASHLKHEASIINFIAAYGTHALITGETTLEGKRDAAITLILGEAFGKFAAMEPPFEMPADRDDFLNGTGAYGAAGALGGLENVDLWIGGLAEAITPFGGMLGSTFNFVFETQMERLQNGDRFYYLQRLDGLHLFGEMEANSFAALIMRNTDATHLPSDVFSTPGLILEVDQTRQFNDLDGDGTLESVDPVGTGLLTQLVIRNNPATTGPDTNYLRYTGGDHVILGGTDNADILIGGIGDDTLFGDGGNDNLEGGHGNDIINGGDGDDIIRDMGGDDNIKGGDGNDAIHAGPGLDLVLGGRGQDFVVLGTDMGSEVFGGEGNDFILGNKNAERILGNEGDDWLETGTFDGAPGDNFDEIFAHDGIRGNDVFLGDGGFDEFIGEGGDDIMVGSPGRGKMAGMSGFDWATYKDNVAGVNADLSIPIVFDEAPVLPQNAALDEFESMEGLSGSAFNDILKGSEEDATTRLPAAQGGSTGYLGSALDAQGIALINGLQAVLGTGVTTFLAGDIILGGDGSDEIQGNAGDDIIDGDKWLDVQIGVFAANDPNHTGTPLRLVNSMKELTSEVFSGLVNPGQLAIVRTIRTDSTPGDIDTAVFRDVSTNFSFSLDADGRLLVSHAIEDGIEGTDTLSGIERLRFTDGTYAIVMGTPFNDNSGANPATDRPALTGTDANEIIVGLAGGDILNGNGGNDVLIGGADGASGTYADNFDGAASYTDNNGTLSFTGGWVEAGDGTASPSGGDVFIDNGRLRFANGADGGETLARAFSLAGASAATLSFDYEADDLDNGETVVVEAFNGTGWDSLGTLGGDTSASFSAALNPAVHSQIRFRTTGTFETGENFYVNNLVINVQRGDRLNGGLGNDTYGFGLSDGNDIIAETGGTDRITIARGTTAIPLAALSATRQANGDLTLGFNGQTVTVTGEFGNNANARVELVNFSNNVYGGTVLAGDYAISFDTNDDDDGDGIDELGPVDPNTGSLVVGTAAADNLLGSGENDILFGGAGSDTLTGDGGNDLLLGGAGNDDMTGNDGDDTYEVDTTGDSVTENANEGIDTVMASVGFTLGTNVENLTLTGASGINGTGNALDNVINGNAGQNQLFGGGGNDILDGGGDNDLLDGGSGNDTLNGGFGNDTVIGGEGDDTITVSDGNDTLRYSANGFGADTVTGFDADAAGGQDLIDLSGMGITAANFAARVTIADVTGPNAALITVDGGTGGTIRLNGVAAASLSQADFVLGTATVNTITGTNTGQTHLGTNNADLINALGGNDTVNAGGGNDVVNGGEGADTLNGGEGNDTLTGGLGASTGTFADDFGGAVSYTDNNGTLSFNGGWTEGGGENTNANAGDIQIDTANSGRLHFDQGIDGGETIQRAFDLTGATSASVQFAYFGDAGLTAGESVSVEAWNHTTNSWQALAGGVFSTASGTFSIALTAAQIGPQSAIRFTANGDWDTGDDFFIDSFVVNATGSLGVDTVNGDNGDDTIVWNANAANPTDSRQVVNGGAEGLAGDTFVINGRTGAETYTIYTRAAFAAIAGNSLAGFHAATEIIVTRNGTNNAAVIAELRDIEEIRINGYDPNGSGSPGGDTFNIVGDFSATSLRLNTITIDGNVGDDVIDISALSSAHRIVFKSNGGHDTIIGTLRPQDVIELPPGSTLADFVQTTDENGVTTLSDGEHSIRYVSHGGPPIIDDGEDDEEEDDEDEDDDDVPSVGGPLLGTPQDDVLLGTSGGDLVFGFAGTDYIIANAGVDVVRAGAGDDFVDAGAGRDIIFADDGDDDVFGGDDDDLIYGEGGHDRLFGGAGNDLIEAGNGNDTVFGGAGNDLFVASLNDGNDTYYGGELSGDAGNDTLDMAFLTTDAKVDLGTGVGGRGSAVSAESGTDTLYGVENVVTGAGNDVITMSNAVNVVDGGAGEDIFVFGSAAAAHGDTIRGFEAGDKLDLSGIDANAGLAGNNSFTLQSGQAATAPGQIVVTHETREDGEYTVISGNTAGDNAPEFRISIAGNHALTGSDFNL
ncbi:MAG TPA: peroxidase family protein [Devosia sp.]|nr:peroxidase family protein [Devosia sp.]